jgi:hypothetical protein
MRRGRRSLWRRLAKHFVESRSRKPYGFRYGMKYPGYGSAESFSAG